MNPIVSEEDYQTAKYLIVTIYKELKKKHPKLKSVESNLFHFIIYDLNKKFNLKLANGWYIWGPYFLAVDDVLVKEGWMDAKYHQLTGTEYATMREKLIECDCHG